MNQNKLYSRLDNTPFKQLTEIDKNILAVLSNDHHQLYKFCNYAESASHKVIGKWKLSDGYTIQITNRAD